MNIQRFAHVAAIGALLGAGCTHQDFDRPLSAPVSDLLDSRKPYVSTNRTAEAELRARKLAEALAAWQRDKTPDSDDYTMGPNDVVEIAIMDFEEPGKLSKVVRTVSRDGQLELPWIGNIPAGGRKPHELRKSVVDALAGRFLKNPDVTVSVATPASKAIIVTGAVSRPGIHYLDRNSKSLLEVLAKVDGLTTEAGDELNIIRGAPPDAIAAAAAGDEAPTNTENLITIDLRKLIDDGDMRQNVDVTKGDIVTVPVQSRDFFYVLGFVGRPGAFELRKGNPIGALQAVALAGGVTPLSRAENSFLLRETLNGQLVIPIDLTKIAAAVRPNVNMEPGDTLVIGTSFVGRLSEFVRPSVGAGVSYTPALVP